MPTNNFIQFNSNKENMMNDESYKTQAPNGIVGGGTVADNTLHNKLFYQLSTFSKAFSIFMNNEGYECNDDDLNTLVDNITGSIKDIKTEWGSDGLSFTIPELEVEANLSGVNGYIKFGKLLGGMMLQYGYYEIPAGAGAYTIVTYPLSFTKFPRFFWKVVSNAANEEIGVTNVQRNTMRIQKGNADATYRNGFYYVMGI